MSKRVFLSLCILILFFSSCTKKEEPLQEPDEILTRFNIIPIEQPCIDSSKLIYHNRLDPKPLNNDQLKKLSDQIRFYGKQVNDVWFGRMLYNNSSIFTATIYFKPSRSSRRIKQGKYFHCPLIMFTDLAKDSEKPRHFEIPLTNSLPVKLPEYIYVTPSEQAECTSSIPSSQLAPFASPKGLTNQEIIEIVDFVRSGPAIKRNDDDSLFVSYYPDVDTERPIHSIKKVDGSIEVLTGSQEGPLAGSGQSLTIKKTNDGYELISIGMWMS